MLKRRHRGIPACRRMAGIIIHSMSSHLSLSRQRTLSCPNSSYAYWREAEVEALAPAPDTVQPNGPGINRSFRSACRAVNKQQIKGQGRREVDLNNALFRPFEAGDH